MFISSLSDELRKCSDIRHEESVNDRWLQIRLAWTKKTATTTPAGSKAATLQSNLGRQSDVNLEGMKSKCNLVEDGINGFRRLMLNTKISFPQFGSSRDQGISPKNMHHWIHQPSDRTIESKSDCSGVSTSSATKQSTSCLSLGNNVVEGVSTRRSHDSDDSFESTIPIAVIVPKQDLIELTKNQLPKDEDTLDITTLRLLMSVSKELSRIQVKKERYEQLLEQQKNVKHLIHISRLLSEIKADDDRQLNSRH